MAETEREVVNPFPFKRKFYKRFVNDIINKRGNDQPDQLFEKFNNNKVKVNYTVELCPERFLDTKVIYEQNSITTKVYRNERKLPVHWSTQILKRYERNAITSDLNRPARMASVPGNEIPEINVSFLMLTIPLSSSMV